MAFTWGRSTRRPQVEVFATTTPARRRRDTTFERTTERALKVTTDDYYTVFENTGDSDWEIARFTKREDLIHYLDTGYTKVGQITDYNLYIKNTPCNT